jgi:DNA repair exonuclease SbcCD ATPase subunit
MQNEDTLGLTLMFEEVTKLRQNISDVTKESQKFVIELGELKNELKAQDNERTQLELRNDQLQNEINALKTENERLSKMKAADKIYQFYRETLVDKLKKENEIITKKAQSIASTLNEDMLLARNEIDVLKKESKGWEEKFTELEVIHRIATMAIDSENDTTEKIKVAEKQKNDLELNSLKAEFIIEKQKMNQNIRSLENELGAKKNESELLKNTNEILRKETLEMNEIKKKMADLKTELAKAKQENVGKSNTVNSLRQQIQNLEADAKTKQKRFEDDLQQRVSLISEEKMKVEEGLRYEIKVQQANIDNMTKNLKSLSNKRKDSEKKQQLKEEIEKNKRVIAELEEKLAKEANENRALQGQAKNRITELETNIKQLQGRAENRVKELESALDEQKKGSKTLLDGFRNEMKLAEESFKGEISTLVESKRKEVDAKNSEIKTLSKELEQTNLEKLRLQNRFQRFKSYFGGESIVTNSKRISFYKWLVDKKTERSFKMKSIRSLINKTGLKIKNGFVQKIENLENENNQQIQQLDKLNSGVKELESQTIGKFQRAVGTLNVMGTIRGLQSLQSDFENDMELESQDRGEMPNAPMDLTIRFK